MALAFGVSLQCSFETEKIRCKRAADLPTLADCPVQLIWGMRDWCFRPECLDRLAAVFPHAEIHRLADAGHYVVEDALERIIPLVSEFLDRPAAEVTRHVSPTSSP